MSMYEGGGVIASDATWGMAIPTDRGPLWIFTPVDVDSYSVVELEINPVTASSPLQEKSIEFSAKAGPFGESVIRDGGNLPATAQCAGTVLTQGQFENVEYLIQADTDWVLTDDLGRNFQIYITGIDMKRTFSSTLPYRHDFTIDYVVVAADGVTVPVSGGGPPPPPSAFAFRSAGALLDTATDGNTIPWPVGIVNGDVVILFVLVQFADADFPGALASINPGGWVQGTSSNAGTFTPPHVFGTIFRTTYTTGMVAPTLTNPGITGGSQAALGMSAKIYAFSSTSINFHNTWGGAPPAMDGAGNVQVSPNISGGPTPTNSWAPMFVWTAYNVSRAITVPGTDNFVMLDNFGGTAGTGADRSAILAMATGQSLTGIYDTPTFAFGAEPDPASVAGFLSFFFS